VYNIYLISSTIEGDTCYKIGYTNNNDINVRLASLQVGNPHKLILRGYIKGSLELEKHIHSYHRDTRISGEWFDLTEQEVNDILSGSHKIYINKPEN